MFPEMEVLSKDRLNKIEIFVLRLIPVSPFDGFVLVTPKGAVAVAAGNARSPNKKGSGFGVQPKTKNETIMVFRKDNLFPISEFIIVLLLFTTKHP